MPSKRTYRLLEFALWVLAASTVLVVGSGAVGFVVGNDLVAAKFAVFLTGLLTFGLGSLLIQPSGKGSSPQPPPSETDAADGGLLGGPGADMAAVRRQAETQANNEHRYESKLQRIGPLADHYLPFEERVGRNYKVFATGVVVLLASFLMEVAGIHV